MEGPEKLHFNTSDIYGVLDIYSNEEPGDSIEYIRKDISEGNVCHNGDKEKTTRTHELTWRDVDKILCISDWMGNDDYLRDTIKTMSREEYCQEILKKFNATKNTK